MSEPGPKRAPSDEPAPDLVLVILRELVEELHPRSKGSVEVGLDSRLDRAL